MLSCEKTNEAQVIGVASLRGVFPGLYISLLLSLFCDLTDALSRTLMCLSNFLGSYKQFAASTLMLTLGTNPFCSVVKPDSPGFQTSHLLHHFNESIITCCLCIKTLALSSCSTSPACFS